MAVNSTSNHPKALWPGVYKFFGVEYDKYPAEYPMLFKVAASDKAFEEVVKTHGFGLAPQKPEGEPVSFTSNSQLWLKRFTHLAYAYGARVTKEEIRFNQYKTKAFERAATLAESMRQTIETVGAQTYNRATTAGYTGGDGVVLLSTAHPDATGGTQVNRPTNGTDLSEAALEDLLILVETAKDDVNLIKRLMPNKLLVHPNDGYRAERILVSNLQSGNANNDINAIRSRSMLPGGYAVCHYFTDSDQWFVKMREGNVAAGMMMFTTDGFPTPELERDNDFHTKDALMSVYAMFSVGWGDWRDVYGSPGI